MDPYASFAPFYDYTPLYVNREDARFYFEEAKASGGPVLELGCGSGRVLAPIARAGIAITGLDPSASMLELCRKRLAVEGSTADLVSGDMRRFSLGRKFPLITIPFRPFQHLLEVEDQMACLAAVREHLAPGGRLIFDVFDPDLKRLAEESDIEVPVGEFDLPDGRHARLSYCRREHDRTRQVQNVEMIVETGGDRHVSSLWLRYCFRWEMEHLLARCGFRIEHLYGSFARDPVSASTGELIFVTTDEHR